MINNYIFDFGNVLAEFYPDQLTAPFVQEPKLRKRISEIVFDRLYWDQLDDGSITDNRVKAGIRSRVSDEYVELACTVYDNWVKSLTPVVGMVQLISDICKTDKKLYLLSNISIGFANTYGEVPWIKDLFSAFDGLVFSGPIGLVKPDKKIFEYLLNQFDLKAEECLFIDDAPKNIVGAKKVGICGYLFDGDAERLRRYLDL
ncbi:MAG: HAD family phosphatase [Ruminococcaceae bacterium]|nr:HAD family phosphatase [Oscillospiraceae bacterium]